MSSYRFATVAALLASEVFLVPASDSVVAQCEIHETHKLTASNGAASDGFGYAVSISGNVLVVGAPYRDCPAGADCGSAYVFRFNGVDWVEEAELVPSDLAPSDYFGRGVAINGGRVVIGADGSDPNGVINAGAAYVFGYDGNSWVQEAKLLPSDAAMSDRIGPVLAISGDRAFLGAPNKPYSGVASVGALYIFRRQGTTWVQEAKMLPANPCDDEFFGYAVSAYGDRVLVGVPGGVCENNVASPFRGAFVFRLEGASWLQEAQLPAPAGSQIFGISVSLSEDAALVGGYIMGVFPNPDESTASVFRRSGNTWSIEKTIGPLGGSTTYIPLALEVDAAAVGAWWDDSNGNSLAGTAPVYLREGNSWPEVGQLTSSDATTGDRLGWTVSMSGNRALVGAPFKDELSGMDAGSVYIFDLPHDCNANGVSDGCDISAGASPDLDGNGYPDECCVAVNAPAAEPGAVAKNRYITLEPGNPGALTALRVTLSSLHHPDPPNLLSTADFGAFEGGIRWVGPPSDFSESSSDGTIFRAARLQCAPHYMDWSAVGLLHVYGTEVLPSSVYDVQTILVACSALMEADYSAPLTISTSRWGDVAPPYQQTCVVSGCSPCTAENCRTQPNALDVTYLVNKFKNLPGAPSKVEAQLQPDAPDPFNDLNALDIVACVDALKGSGYAYGGPTNCPP